MCQEMAAIRVTFKITWHGTVSAIWRRAKMSRAASPEEVKRNFGGSALRELQVVRQDQFHVGATQADLFHVQFAVNRGITD